MLKFSEDEQLPGTRFRTYRGAGTLVATTDQQTDSYPCEFLCAQMIDGRLLCHCSFTAERHFVFELISLNQKGAYFHLVGTCEEGTPFQAYCLQRESATGSTASFFADQLHAGQDVIASAFSVRFHLVSLTLHGASVHQWNHRGLSINLQRCQDYDRVLTLLRAVGGVGVTSEARLSSPNETDLLGAATLMDDELCPLLSIARANLVQWIAFEALDVNGHTLAWRHRNPVTKPFSPYKFIDEADTAEFVSQTLPHVAAVDERWRFHKVVLMLVDAAIATDFTEARGLKAAALLDFLCARFREINQQEHVLEKKSFDRWAKEARKALRPLCDQLQFSSATLRQWAGSNDEERKKALIDEMLRHLPVFNRYTFEASLRRFLRQLDFEVPNEELKHVVGIRNELVHEARFPSQKQPSVAPHQRTDVMLQEYHLLLRYIVQILLALIGYKGRYNDWPRFGTDEEARAGLAVPMPFSSTTKRIEADTSPPRGQSA